MLFNLGGSYAVSGMAVWNLNNLLNNYGVQALTIQGSTDGVIFSAIAGTPTSFSMGLTSSEAAQIFAFSTTVSYIQFNITSNYGGIDTGLSEVMFTTGTATAGTPEPATGVLFGVGLAALKYLRHWRSQNRLA